MERFKTTVDFFAQLDNRFGGGHARESLIQYLNTDGVRLLRGQYSENVERAVHSAVAEATLLAAWMTYDSPQQAPWRSATSSRLSASPRPLTTGCSAAASWMR